MDREPAPFGRERGRNRTPVSPSNGSSAPHEPERMPATRSVSGSRAVLQAGQCVTWKQVPCGAERGRTQMMVSGTASGRTSTLRDSHLLSPISAATAARADALAPSRSSKPQSDVLALADGLNWLRFAIVGHSTSALVALHPAQNHADRISHVVALTPPPLAGFGADDSALARAAASRELAFADDATRLAVLSQRFAARLSPGWTRFNVSRLRAGTDPAAAAAYVAMFPRDGLPNPTDRITAPASRTCPPCEATPSRADRGLFAVASSSRRSQSPVIIPCRRCPR